MRLRSKLIITVMIIIVLQMIGSFYISIKQTQRLVATQLKENAQNTAYTLALSLQDKLLKKDIKSMDLIARAVFDSGEYQKVNIVKSDGSYLSHYEVKEIKIQSVPKWFIQLIDLKAPQSESDLIANWKRFGTVEIQVLPAFSYISLWDNMKQISFWVILLNLGSIIFIMIMLKILLKPMKESIKQINGFILGEYNEQKNYPHTLEFKELVIATNKIGKRLSYLYQRVTDINNKIKNTQYFVSDTSLTNEKYLKMRLNSLLTMKKEYIFGTLSFIETPCLTSNTAKKMYDYFYKNHDLWGHGSFISKYQQGILFMFPFLGAEKSICAIDSLLKNQKDFSVTRRSATLLISGYWNQESTQDIFNKIDQLIEEFPPKKNTKEWLLSHCQPDIEKKIIDSVKHKKIKLYTYPVYFINNSNKVFFMSAHSKIVINEEAFISKNSFSKIAENHNLGDSFDKLMINNVFNELKEGESEKIFSVTLSRQSLNSDRFLVWLNKFLRRNKNVARNLCIVLNESDLLNNIGQGKRLNQILIKYGTKLGLNDFGRNAIDLTHLKKFKIEFLKINNSFTVSIEKSEENQHFVKELTYLCDTLNIPTVAISVATQKEITILKQLGVKAYSLV